MLILIDNISLQLGSYTFGTYVYLHAFAEDDQV